MLRNDVRTATGTDDVKAATGTEENATDSGVNNNVNNSNSTDSAGNVSTDNSSNDSIIAQLLEQNNRLLEALISTVDSKELVVDEESMVSRVSRGLGKKYKSESFSKGKGGH